MLIVVAVVLAPLLLLVVEGLMARRGPSVDTPDVATLSATHTPEGGAGREVRLLWLGDSTAAAVGTSEARYAVSSEVGEAISAACGVSANTRVIAKSGARIDDVVRDQVPVAADLGADIVLISVGANDTIQLTSRHRFETEYRKVVAALVAAGIEADHIILLGVPDMGSPPRLAQPLRAIAGQRSRSLDKVVKRLARENNTGYVDLFAGTSTPFRKDPKRYFAADNYHPSDDGYALWARTILPVLEPICAE